MIFRKPPEPSVRGIMYSCFTVGIVASVIDGYIFEPYLLIPLSLAILSFILQFMLFSFVNESFKRGKYRRIIAPLAIISLPYILAAIYGDLLLVIILIIFKAILLLLTGLPYRVNPDNMLSYLIGTLLITTVYLDPPVFLTNISPDTIIIWVILATYFTSTSYYVESRLAHREVNPIYPFITWIWLIPISILLNPNILFLIAMVEPTIKHIYNIFNNVKFSKAVDIVRMGRMEMRRGYLFISLIILGIILEQFINLNIVEPMIKMD